MCSSAQMPTPPCLHKPNAAIILKNYIYSYIYIYIFNTLQFDQYSRFAILLNIFGFSTKIFGFQPKFQKLIFKIRKNFSLVCGAH